MTRILAYTSPARGHLFPVVPILDELRRRGHRIALRTLAAETGAMRGCGFAAAPMAPALERMALDDYRGRTPLAAQQRAVRTFCARAAYDAADLREAIRVERPDVLLVDVNCWGAQAVAEAWGGPWAVWCPYPLPLASRDAPPFGPGLAPARGAIGRLRDAALRRILFRLIEGPLVRQINAMRADFALAPLASASDIFAAPPLLLYLTAEPFEYPRSDWPANIRLVGPCDWNPAAPPPAWLDAIEKPLILVTTSSEFQDDGKLVRCALEALADEPVEVVATIPSGDPASFAAPLNARVLPFTPHAPILDRAACAITHGGMGATQKALARGVPVCAVPFGRDQLEVARRVEVAGAGTRLPASRLRPDRLRAKLRQAMQCSDGAGRIAAAFRAAGGAAAAADDIEALANGSGLSARAVQAAS